MPLQDDKNHRVEISRAEFERLGKMLEDNNRLGMYLRLHELSGSQAALDMAEIGSSSGLRGGTAWALNQAYASFVPGYPKEGVEHFSKEIAKGDLALIERDFDITKRYLIPTDLEMYEGAQKTWNEVGKHSNPPNERMGDQYFPGLAVLAMHYAETGNFSKLKAFTGKTQWWKPAVGGAVAGAWEGFTELVADNTNNAKTLNELMDQRADLHPRPHKSPSGDEMVVFETAQGKPEHVVRISAGRNALVDQPVSFGEKMADGLNIALPIIKKLNALGETLAQVPPTPTELSQRVDQLMQRFKSSGDAKAPAHRGEERQPPAHDPRLPGERAPGAPEKSFLDLMLDRVWKGASVQGPPDALTGVVQDYLRSPQGAQFQTEVAQMREQMQIQFQVAQQAQEQARQVEQHTHRPQAMSR